MLELLKVLIVLAVLFLVSTTYAIVLDRHPQWYIPDRTWLTVVIGNGFIVLALAAMELWGIALTSAHVVAANATAGAPIIIWQLVQTARRNGEREARLRNKRP